MYRYRYMLLHLEILCVTQKKRIWKVFHMSDLGSLLEPANLFHSGGVGEGEEEGLPVHLMDKVDVRPAKNIYRILRLYKLKET